MKTNEIFAGAKVKEEEGYELMTLVDEDGKGEWYQAVIHRTETDDYVFCRDYNISTGTWLNGDYCRTYRGALSELVGYLEKRDFIYEKGNNKISCLACSNRMKCSFYLEWLNNPNDRNAPHLTKCDSYKRRPDRTRPEITPTIHPAICE